MIKSNTIELSDFRMREGEIANCTSRAISNGMAFLRRDFAISTSYKLQFVLQFAQMFFGVTVIYFIGRMVSASGPSRLLEKYNADYFTFAIVGFAIDSYLKAGILAITVSVRQSMSQGVLEAVFAAPVSYAYVLLCTTLWPFVFATVRLGVYFLCGILAFGMELPNANWIGAVLVLILATPTSIMLGIISSSILILIKRGDPINSFFLSNKIGQAVRIKFYHMKFHTIGPICIMKPLESIMLDHMEFFLANAEVCNHDNEYKQC